MTCKSRKGATRKPPMHKPMIIQNKKKQAKKMACRNCR